MAKKERNLLLQAPHHTSAVVRRPINTAALREILKERDLSYQDVVNHLNDVGLGPTLSRQCVYHWLTGKLRPSVYHIRSLAKKFKFDGRRVYTDAPDFLVEPSFRELQG